MTGQETSVPWYGLEYCAAKQMSKRLIGDLKIRAPPGGLTNLFAEQKYSVRKALGLE